ncbi:hypothetical protein [Petroclostridium sp. X23]|nr:hypothetical protein [Petroclostridium sp. X23]WHH58760.1 hypothetical protein QKW49_23705 [Petroclostridium sp. X23]
MKEKKKDKDIVKDAIGDPAFYNDQIAANREPVKATMDNKKNAKSKNGL